VHVGRLRVRLRRIAHHLHTYRASCVHTERDPGTGAIDPQPPVVVGSTTRSSTQIAGSARKSDGIGGARTGAKGSDFGAKRFHPMRQMRIQRIGARSAYDPKPRLSIEMDARKKKEARAVTRSFHGRRTGCMFKVQGYGYRVVGTGGVPRVHRQQTTSVTLVPLEAAFAVVPDASHVPCWAWS